MKNSNRSYDSGFVEHNRSVVQRKFFICLVFLAQSGRYAMDKVDVELLISLVEARPSLWDRTVDDYKDKNSKVAAWKEICGLLFENFEEMEQRERQKIRKLLVTKWTHIRDAWTKSLKKHKDGKKSGFAAKKPRPYLYHKQMSFLKKVTDMTVVHESTEKSDDGNDNIIDVSDSEPHNTQKDETQFSPESARNKKWKLDALDAAMIKFMERQMASPNVVSQGEDENRHLLFFQSILPSLIPFDDDEILEFQTGVLHLIRQIRAQKRHFEPHRTQMQYGYNQTFGDRSNQRFSVQTPQGYYTKPATNTDVAPPMPSPSDKSQQSPAAQSSTSEGSVEYSQQYLVD